MRRPIGLSIPYRKVDKMKDDSWVGLTPAEEEALLREWDAKGGGTRSLIRLTEAKLQKKNK